MAKILLKKKGSAQKEILLDEDTITIGRQPMNHVHLDDPAVSGLHARVVKEGKLFLVEDLNSLNGTLVNGKNISQKGLVVLNNGDNISIGKNILTFVYNSERTDGIKVFRKGRPFSGTVMINNNAHEQITTKNSREIGSFVVLKGSLDKKKYLLSQKNTSIGKDKNAEIRLKGFFTPKVAALISKNKEDYFINSAGRRKVLKINGKKINEEYKLEDGDTIEVVNVSLKFSMKK